ncbi:MAG: PAS domain-containing protein [Archangium sp.]|nr:PAS domain-containing protein [Archangium sp.]
MLDLLTQFIRNSPVIAFIKDLDGRYMLISNAWVTAFRTSREAVEGRTDHELFSKEQADAFVTNDQEVLASRMPSRRFEEVLVPPEVRTFFSTKFPVYGAGGELMGVAGFALDVTEQHSVVRDLERQKRFLERTQAVTDVGGWEYDGATRTLVWTSETFRIFGVSEREFEPTLERAVERFVPEHREAVRVAHERGLTKGTPFRLEVELERPGGKRRRVRVHGIPEAHGGAGTRGDHEPRRLSGAIQDVTEERLVEEKLRHASRMDAVGQLAGGVAHDFNNMLGAIMSASELLKFEVLAPSAQESVNTILSAATQAASLTRQLLQFSRKDHSHRVPADLHSVLDDALHILQRTLDRRITLVVERNARHSKLLADAAQLSNAFINLALNARDAMPDGGTLTFRTTDDQPGLMRLDVADTGIGMAPEVMAHIFDPFFTTKERGRGTGLGLATVDSAVRGHDGDITVRSEIGEGTTFQLRFPVLADEEASTPAQAPLFAPEGGQELILVVDDEDLVRRSLSRLLARLGYRVLEAPDGAKALEVLAMANPKPALVVLDLMMPGLSAKETFFAMRQILPELPVLFCSGYAPEDLLAILLAQPKTGRLHKPFSTDALEKEFKALLPTT